MSAVSAAPPSPPQVPEVLPHELPRCDSPGVAGPRPGSGLAAYLAGIWACRHFWLSLVKLDLQARYRRSILGVGWSLLHPIAMTAILCLVFHRIFHVPVHEYAPFLLAGLACWNYLVGVTLQGCQCFLQAESYIRQHPAPMAIYPLRTVLGAGFHLLVGIAVVLALAGVLNGFNHPLVLLSLIPSLLLLFVLGWSLAVLAGLINLHFRDVQHLSEIAFQMLFYLSPIMYRPEILHGTGFEWLMTYNPVRAFLSLLREPILNGQLPSAACYAAAVGATALALVLAALALRRGQRRIVFHL